MDQRHTMFLCLISHQSGLFSPNKLATNNQTTLAKLTCWLSTAAAPVAWPLLLVYVSTPRHLTNCDPTRTTNPETRNNTQNSSPHICRCLLPLPFRRLPPQNQSKTFRKPPRGPPDHGSGRRIAPRQRSDRSRAGLPQPTGTGRSAARLRPPLPGLKKLDPAYCSVGALLYWSLASRLCAIALARACALGSARPPAPFVFTGSSLRPESFPSSRSALRSSSTIATHSPPVTVLARVQRVGADQYSTTRGW
jgi:hypothetical protein